MLLFSRTLYDLVKSDTILYWNGVYPIKNLHFLQTNSILAGHLWTDTGYKYWNGDYSIKNCKKGGEIFKW